MIEQHVTSLSLSKKLHELGVRRESLFYWIVNTRKPVVVFREDTFSEGIIPAYLSSELGEMLPFGFIYKEKKCFVSLEKNKTNHGDWASSLLELYHCTPLYYEFSNTPQDSQAKMLIHLLEQGLVKKEEL